LPASEGAEPPSLWAVEFMRAIVLLLLA